MLPVRVYDWALFLLNGVSLQNIFWGLLVGNFLAVLSWRYLCAPIAVGARYTLYYHLEKIAGGQLVKVFNLANGVLFCFWRCDDHRFCDCGWDSF